MMDIDRPFYGWANWGTWKAVEVFERNKRYNRHLDMVIDDCAEDGMTRDQAIDRVADEIKDIVFGEFYDAQQQASELVLELMFGPKDLDLDYRAIAEHFMGGYRPRQSSDNRRPKTSQCKRNGASKPKATAKKAPAKKATSGRR